MSTMFWLHITLQASFIALTRLQNTSANGSVNAETRLEYTLLYELMKNAYFEEDWENCVNHGLAAVTQYNNHMQYILGCRSSCKQPTEKASKDQLVSRYSDSLREITCIRRCIPQEKSGDNMQHNFMSREPYDFIQLCYFKLQDYPRAAAAATTFLAVNPKHSYMNNNKENYKNILNVTAEHFVDLEAGEYESLYKRGLDSYEKYQWSEQIVYMAAALDSYHDNYNNCSLMCEVGYDVLREGDHNHEAIGAIADQMERVIPCKHQCRTKLSKLDLKPVEDIVANIYHHLQYAYSKAHFPVMSPPLSDLMLS